MVVESPFSQIHPMFYALEEGQNNQQVLKLAGNRPIDQSLAGVQSVFEKFDPETPFNYEFVEVSYAQKFDTINRLSKLINIFASLAIFISCLGLFGLASYMTAKRAKEIGVRKVLGATVSGLWIMLSKDFLLLILISLVIAAPLAAWFMGDWLTSFDYHASIAWWTFAVTGLGAFIIALITVSYQSIKAALLNPVKSLRSE